MVGMASAPNGQTISASRVLPMPGSPAIRQRRAPPPELGTGRRLVRTLTVLGSHGINVFYRWGVGPGEWVTADLRWETNRSDIPGQRTIWCMQAGTMCLKRSGPSTGHQIRFYAIDSDGAEGVSLPITVSIDQGPN